MADIKDRPHFPCVISSFMPCFMDAKPLLHLNTVNIDTMILIKGRILSCVLWPRLPRIVYSLRFRTGTSETIVNNYYKRPV